MAMSPTFALAHVFLPNLVKLKNASTIVGVVERREKFFFDQLWNQAHVEHVVALHAELRGEYRFGVIDLPAPREMGEAYFAAIVAKTGDASWGKLFLLEHDYVLSTKTERTMVSEREGQRHTKHFEGPKLTGDKAVDAKAFVDAIMELFVPTKVTGSTERKWS